MPEPAVIHIKERQEAPGRFRSAGALVLRDRWRPDGRYLLGTDTQGRDVLSRVLYGARPSLMVGLTSQSVAVTLGVLLGLVAGYYQRWVDATVMRLADVTLAFPTLLLALKRAEFVLAAQALSFVGLGDALREAFDPNVSRQP